MTKNKKITRAEEAELLEKASELVEQKLSDAISPEVKKKVAKEKVEGLAKAFEAGYKGINSRVPVTVNKHGYASIPQYKTKGSAGCDACANITMPLWIKPGEIKLIPTGLKVRIPEGYEIQVRPRSGLALGKGITVLNSPGTIDSDFREELGVILCNFGDQNFEVKRGDRVAQLVLQKVEQIEWNEASNEEWQELLDTETLDRQGGFGSTGV